APPSAAEEQPAPPNPAPPKPAPPSVPKQPVRKVRVSGDPPKPEILELLLDSQERFADDLAIIKERLKQLLIVLREHGGSFAESTILPLTGKEYKAPIPQVSSAFAEFHKASFELSKKMHQLHETIVDQSIEDGIDEITLEYLEEGGVILTGSDAKKEEKLRKFQNAYQDRQEELLHIHSWPMYFQALRAP
ncbi:MAG: hypothetical protein LBC42_01885, partial [Puniceicoccales bacterium]|nr:hypothetical protein [Puniceicoccales bacterium]